MDSTNGKSTAHWVDNAKPIPIHHVRTWALRLLMVSAALAVSGIILEAVDVSYLLWLQSGGIPDKFTPGMLDTVRGVLGLCQLFVLIVSIFPVAKWFYRAYSNIGASSRLRLNHTPRFYVASFFIPFVNLYTPYKITLELWDKALQNFKSLENVRNLPKKTLHDPPPIGLWWACWLATNFLGRISALTSSETISSIINGMLLGIAGDVAGVSAALLLIAVIKRVTEIQDDSDFLARHPQTQNG